MLLLLLHACDPVVYDPDSPPDSADTADDSDSPVDSPTGFRIDAIDPDQGPAAGGTLVEVRGGGYSAASSVTVGGAPCATLAFVSADELVCVTPAGPLGDTQIEVTEAGVVATAPFTYLPDRVDTGPIDTGPGPAVEGCTLLEPLELVTERNTSTDAAHVEVVVTHRTDAAGSPGGVDVQFGYGNSGSNPWGWAAWSDAYWVADTEAGDEFQDYLFPTVSGAFAFAARVRVDHGDWTYCADAEGEWGALAVTEPETIPVDYCHLQWPCTTTVGAGDESEDIYAWVWQEGVTDDVGEGLGLWVDIGVGPPDTDPIADFSWNWYSMDYNADKDGLSEGDVANDEYVGTFYAPASPGTYGYVARVSADEGTSWTICDVGGDSCPGGGSSDGYDPADAGVCTVE